MIDNIGMSLADVNLAKAVSLAIGFGLDDPFLAVVGIGFLITLIWVIYNYVRLVGIWFKHKGKINVHGTQHLILGLLYVAVLVSLMHWFFIHPLSTSIDTTTYIEHLKLHFDEGLSLTLLTTIFWQLYFGDHLRGTV
jgi:hypothetical protein